MISRAVAKYLRTYAEAECAALAGFPALAPQGVLVIPAYRETPEFAEHIARLQTPGLLVIVVINQPPGPEEPLNQALMRFFGRYPTVWRKDHLTLFSANAGALHWLVVDRFHSGLTLDPKQGVGLARKLGCDLAVALMADAADHSAWIACTDADAFLPAHYFQALASCPQDPVATVFDIEHQSAEGEAEGLVAATRLYERALRYYVDGLTWAGSPYAFPTIGSALAVRVQAYCECRGFPRKSAGEDFYLLNKLAKLGRVHWCKDVVIGVKARLSDRVPFGTGPAVEKILTLPNPRELTYYAPSTFVELRTWLRHIPSIWQQLQDQRDPLEGLPAHLPPLLREAGIDILWAHIRRQVRSPAHCETSVHHWFDAFQTLKFIRRLQESHYPALPLDQCLTLAPFYQEPFACRTS